MSEQAARARGRVEPLTAPAGETALLERLRRRDAQAFALLFQQCNRRLYRVARAILCDDAEAEDVVQETYVRALTGIDRFRGEAGLSTWLTRIAINEALGRRRARRPSVGLAEENAAPAAADNVALLFGHHPADGGPERAAARGEIRRLVEGAVERLPEPFRLVFVLRAVEGLSVEETAAHLDIRQATVKTRFHRARRLLQQALDDALSDALTDAFPFAGARCERLTENVLSRLGLPSLRIDEQG